jgi:hypothetical protein
MPAPAVQPNSVLLCSDRVFKPVCTLPKAPPPVALKRTRSDGVARAGTDGPNPVTFGFATRRARCKDVAERTVVGALKPLPIPIALDTKDKSAGLKIDAKRAANEAAIGVEAAAGRRTSRGQRRRVLRISQFGRTETVAAVDSEIDAAPIIDRHGVRGKRQAPLALAPAADRPRRLSCSAQLPRTEMRVS